jgi:predicted metal-dependent peptidase
MKKLNAVNLDKVDKKTERNVRHAMTQIVLKSPFFSVLLLQQKMIYTIDIPTFATNGKALFINPIFAATLTMPQIQGVLIHEIMHSVFYHLTRCGERDPRLWNVAGDHAINPIIKSEGFVLPENHLDEDRFRKKSADEIYRILELENPDIDDDLIDLLPTGQMSQSQRTAQEQQVKINVSKAIAAAGDAVPDSIRKLVTSVLESKVDWRTKLREFMQVSLGGDTPTWKKPNRNYLHDGLYLPSYEGRQLDGITIAIDTSGSIYSNDKLFVEFKSEITKIVEDLIPEKVDIYYVDTSIKKHDTYEEGEDVEFDLVGGGGTDFTSFFATLKTEPETSCLIFFTDLWASGLPEKPEDCDIPILWCVYENKGPFPDNLMGEVLVIDND